MVDLERLSQAIDRVLLAPGFLCDGTVMMEAIVELRAARARIAEHEALHEAVMNVLCRTGVEIKAIGGLPSTQIKSNLSQLEWALEHRTQLSSRVRELEAALTPQPMETAPRDGTEIMLLGPDGKSMVASWGSYRFDEGNEGFRQVTTGGFRAIGWLPLPRLPAPVTP